ncbi:hypothetical protein [Rhizobium cremeum]|nr:hypothetical protein [Rhizobium cremeum]
MSFSSFSVRRETIAGDVVWLERQADPGDAWIDLTPGIHRSSA